MGRNTIPTKIRIVEILKLLQGVDKDHPLSQAEIHAALEEKYGVSVSLNSITDDVRVLEKLGLAKTTGQKKIARDTGRGAYGRFDKNYLDAWELKILADAVPQVRWLRRFDVYRLRNKLLGMTSDNIARKVRHTLHMLPQDMYESNLTFVRTLNQLLEAIDRGSKVSFRYSRLGKQRISTGICFETDTKPDRVVSPYDIYMDNGKFYMVGFSDLHQALRSYRVDRIGLLRLTNEPWIPPTRTPVGDVTMALEAFFMNNTDNFLGQKRTVVTIRWDDSTHISVLYDVMGTENVFLISEEDNTFSIRSFDNTGLINNLLRLGSAIEILEPASIRDQYLKIIDAIRAKY